MYAYLIEMSWMNGDGVSYDISCLMRACVRASERVDMLLTWFSASFMIYPNKIDSNDTYSTSSFSTTYAKIVRFIRLIFRVWLRKGNRKNNKPQENFIISFIFRLRCEFVAKHLVCFIFINSAKPNSLDKQVFFSRIEILRCVQFPDDLLLFSVLKLSYLQSWINKYATLV